MLQHNLYHLSFKVILDWLREQFPFLTYDPERHILKISDELQNTLGYLRLPLHLNLDENINVHEEELNVLYLSIESGSAAIIIMEGSANVYHTTFSAYMTRKKQGFSQIKYLNKKGKSRAGSRVRLAATFEFFEKINSTLTDLLKNYPVDRIALSCNKTLIPYLYQSKISCPFDKKDHRLYKIPLHIPQANFNNLEIAIKKLRNPVLFYEAQLEEKLQALLV